jgi:transcription initiation factor IIE alpha subunit
MLAIHVGRVIRNHLRENREEVYYYLICEKCNRRLRYRESQAGKLGVCPLCKKPLMFPKADEEDGRWTRFRRWLKVGSA